MKNNCSIQFSRIPNHLWLSSKKIPRTMKLFTLFFACSLGLAHASESYAQKAIVNVEVQNKTVGEILKEIEKQSEFDFFFDNTLIDLNRRVSVTSRNGDIFKVLEKVFKGTNVKYSILDKKIVLTTNADNTQTVQQITFKVIGKVVDNMGESVIGATVLEQGTTNGTVTDMDGNFELVVSNKEVTLEISYIGYSKSVVKSKVGVPVTVTLKEDTEVLDEVVVVGYGTQKKVNLTGAVSQVGEKALESRPVQNVSQALQGLVPGMTFGVDAKGGQLNNTPSVSIRGAGTIGKGSTGSPLILIDGVEGNMNLLNPLDIESISVLKDASASSIYGSRAPFGVILITTKQGKTGKPVVSYNTNIRFNSPLTDYDMMDSYRFMHYYNDARTNGGQAAYFSDEQIANVLAYQRGEVGKIIPVTTSNTYTHNWANANTDWYDVFFKDHAMSQEHSLSLSGGTERFSYYLSGNFMDQEGLLNYADESYYRYSVNGKINAKINKNISLSYNTKWFRTNYEAPSYLNQLFFHQIMRKWPNAFVTDPQGYWADNSEIIPLKEGGRMKEDLDQNFQQLQLDVTPLPGWNIHLQGNMRITTNFTHTDRQAVYAHDANGEPYAIAITNATQPGQSRVIEKGTKNEFYTVNLFSDYSRQLGDHYFKVMGGFNAEHQNVRTLSAQRDGIIVPDLPTIDTSTEQDVAGGGYNHWATAGFFGRLNYNYKEKYLLEVNGRYDGTSRFMKDQRWNFFPSFSLGWNVARENFWKPLESVVNQFKLRGSWGELGNQNTSNLYPFYEILPVKSNSGNWLVNGGKTNTADIPSLVSTLLTWERVRSFNVGFDFGAFSNRLTGSFDYFVRKTVDMVGPAPQLPLVLGIAPAIVNNADMKSYGFEIELSWRDRIGEVDYGVKFNLADAQQKVVKYPNTTNAFNDWYAGKMSGEIWGYTSLGIAKTDEEMKEHLASLPNGGQNQLGNKWGAGDIMYADINGDGKVDGGKGTLADPGDQRIIGNSTPRYNFGLVLDASYKGFDVSIFFQGVGKRDYAPIVGTNGAVFWGAVNNIWQSMAMEEHFDYFRPEGHPMGANLNGYYPRPDFTSNKNHQVQTRYLQDASYIRLKNLQIGYTLPKQWINKLHINRCRVYVSGDNLWTGTSLASMFDPETLAAGDWGSGKTYPLSKVISFGLNVNF